MSKSRVCAEKTINLAKQSCAKKTNLLVYETQKENELKPERKIYKPPICCPQVKRIKICTGAELKKICAPPPCPCPYKPPPIGLLTRLGQLLGLGIKGAVALAIVYVTYDMGIWGDSQSTAALYKDICQSILPSLIDPPDKEVHLSKACEAELELFSMYRKDKYCCDKFPVDFVSGTYKLQQKWNKIVIAAFAGLIKGPVMLSDWIDKMYCQITSSESEKCKALKSGQTEEDDMCVCED